MLIRIVLIAILVFGAAAEAQDRGRGRRGGGPDRNGPPMVDARLIGGVAGLPGRVVKNAPYSAEAVTESTQTLGDGNRIRRTSTAKIFRDGEGRTRNEQSLAGLGALAPNGPTPRIVFITDPVAGATYALNDHARTATKSRWRSPRGGERPRGEFDGPPEQHPAGANVKTESLGRQTIEGVAAVGRRTTVIVPPGQMGNEQALQIVSETWYSPELSTVLVMRHTDPRSGETVFRLTNIDRDAPSASLFQPPQDYRIIEPGKPR